MATSTADAGAQGVESDPWDEDASAPPRGTPTDDGPNPLYAALLAGVGPDRFYVAQGEDTRPARAMCADCPVRTPCAAAADSHGIWAGTSPGQRRKAGRAAY